MGTPYKLRFVLCIKPRTAAALEERCREAGLRITPERSAVFAAVAMHRETFAFDDILAAARDIEASIGRDTIYRSLRCLKRLGAIRVSSSALRHGASEAVARAL